MAKKFGLTKEQLKFIDAKVRELGSHRATVKFYNLKDEVAAYARQVADDVYNFGINENDEDFEDEVVVEEKPKKKKKAATKKRKRKIDVEEVLSEN